MQFSIYLLSGHRLDCGVGQGNESATRCFSLLTRQQRSPDPFHVSKHAHADKAMLVGEAVKSWGMSHSPDSCIQECPVPCWTTGLWGHKLDLPKTVTSLTRMARSQRSGARVNPKFWSCIFVAVETKSSVRRCKSGHQNDCFSFLFLLENTSTVAVTLQITLFKWTSASCLPYNDLINVFGLAIRINQSKKLV